MFLFGVVATISATSLLVGQVRKLVGGRRRACVQTPIDDLKNALLVFALALCRKDHFGKVAMRYEQYNGSLLPPLNGSDVETACFDYFNAPDSADEKYTRRQRAIDMYLEHNLGTPEDVRALFVELLDCSILKLNVNDYKDE